MAGLNCYGELYSAQLENLAAAPSASAALAGRVFWDTVQARVRVDNGGAYKALLANDGNAVFGTNATAANNVRFHRAGAGQFDMMLGDDATAEGSATPANWAKFNAKIGGSKVDTYLDLTETTSPASPAASTWRLFMKSDGNVYLRDSGGTETAIGPNNQGPGSTEDLQNLGLAVSVAANAMTIALKTKAGADPSAGSPVRVSFRDSTATLGNFNTRTVSGALSLVVPDTAVLGSFAATAQYYYVYLIDNAGTPELAIAGSNLFGPSFDTDNIVSSTSIGTGSDDGATLYSTTGRSNVPCRLIGRILATQATAGTWATAPTNVVVGSVSTPREYKSFTSSTKTPAANNHWLSMTGASLVITPGTWILGGSVLFSNSGTSPAYAQVGSAWCTANGADSTSIPSTPTLDAGRTPSHMSLSSTSATIDYWFNAAVCRITVTVATTLYLVPYVSLTTAANARVISYGWAERVT
jgi:hypothetical protein